MSRNSSGTYTLPNSPVVTGSAISASDENTTRSDLASEMTDSLSRSGKGAMLAPLEASAGSETDPSLTFSTATGTGLFADSANLGISVGGGQVASVGQSVLSLDTITTIRQTGSNTSMTLQGNRSAADSGTDLILNSTATRTAGKLLAIENNGTAKLSVDFAGQILWASGPTDTSTSPGPSAITTISLNTNWSANSGLTPHYWKDPSGLVHLNGSVVNGTGGNAQNIATSGNALPAGFRPAGSREFAVVGTGGSIIALTITSAGGINTNASVSNGGIVFFDGITFLAEA